MGVAAFVILCCALQCITSEKIDEKVNNILNDKNNYETKNETTSDEFEIDPKTGNIIEKRRTYKEFLLKSGCGSDVNEGDVEMIKFFITKDDQGRERIFEEDTLIKKVPGTTVNCNDGIPVTSTSFSSASAASQTPQSNSCVATGSAATATGTGGAGSTSSAASAAGSQGPASGSTSAASSSGQRSNAGGLGSIYGAQYYNKYYNKDGLRTSSAAASAVSGGPGAASSAGSATGNQGPASGSTSAASSSGQSSDAGGPRSNYGAQYYNKYYNKDGLGSISAAASAVSGGPGAASSAASAAGSQGPASGSTSAASSSGQRSDGGSPGSIYGAQNYNKDGLGTSSAAASAVSGGPGAASSAASAAGSQGAASGSTSAASNSGQRSDAGGPGSIYRTQYYNKYNNKGGLRTSSAAASAVSGGPGAASSAGSAAGNQGPASGSTSASSSSGQSSDADALRSIYGAQGSSVKRPNGLDFYGLGFNGVSYFQPQVSYGASSTSSAASVAVSPGPASGSKSAASSSGQRSDAGGPGNMYGAQYNNKDGLGTSSAAASAVSGGPGAASSAASAAGSQGPASGSTSAASSSGLRSNAGVPGSIYGAQYYNKYYNKGGLRTSSAVASAVSGGPGAASSAGSAAGNQGPASGSTSAASSSGQSSDADALRSIYGAQGSSGKRPNGLDFYGLGFNGVSYFQPQVSYGASSTSSAASVAGSPGPASGSKSAASSSGQRSYAGGPGNMYGAQYNNKDGLGTSSAAASAVSGGPGPASSAASAAGSQGPASGSTSAASSSGQSSDAGGLRSISDTQGSSEGLEQGGPYVIGSGRGYPYRPYGIQGPKVLQIQTNRPESVSSCTPGASPTTKEGVSGTRQPGSGPASKPVDSDTITGNHQNELEPDSYGPGYYGQDYLAPQELLIIVDNAGGSANDTNRLELGSSGTPGTSPTTKEGVSGTRRPGSGPASTPVDNITGNNQDELGPDFYLPGYYGQDYSASEELPTVNDNKRDSESSSSPSARAPAAGESAVVIPDAVPTTSRVASGVTSVQAPSSSGQSSDADGPEIVYGAQGSSGKRPNGLDFYGLGFNGVSYFQPQVSYGASSTSSAASVAGSPGPASGSTSAASSSGQSSDAGGLRSISDTQGSSEGLEQGRPYVIGSGRGYPYRLYGIQGPKVLQIQTNRPESVSSCTPDASPTTKEGVSGTPQPGSGPASKPVDSYTITGNHQNELEPDSYGPGYYGQDYLAPQELLIIVDNAGGSATDTNRLESGSSCTPSTSPTTKEGVSGTQRPGSGPASKPVDNITGNNQDELGPDFYWPGYYGQDYSASEELPTVNDNKRDSESSSSPSARAPAAGESAAVIPDAVPTTSGVASGVTSVQAESSSDQRSDAGGPGSMYGAQYNNKDGIGTSSAAASAVSGGPGAASSAASAAGSQGPASGSTSAASRSGQSSDADALRSIYGTQGLSEGLEQGGPYVIGSGRGYPYRPYGIQGPKVLQIQTNRPESVSSCTPGASPTTKEGVSGTRQPGSGPASKPVDSDTITGNHQNELEPDSYGPGYYGQDYLAPQELLIIVDNAGGSATDTNRLESGSSGIPGTSPTTKEGVSGTQRPGSGPDSKPVDNITGNNQDELGPDFYWPGYYGQDYSASEELPTVNDNKRYSESSSSPSARAPAGESAAKIPDAVPTTSGVASGVTSVQGRKRVRQACRLKGSQFVLRLGRKGQKCTFCY